MRRRGFLTTAAGIGAAAAAGCLGDDVLPEGENALVPVTGAFPGETRHEFAGEGDGETEAFEVDVEGPTVLSLDHDGNEQFGVGLFRRTEDDELEPRGRLIDARGPYKGAFAFDLPPGEEFLLDVTASGAWTAAAHLVPVLEEGDSLPLTVRRSVGAVVGPISFDGETTVSFDADGEGRHLVTLKDRHGATAGALFDEQDQVRGATLSLDAQGVGYVQVESFGNWKFSAETNIE